MVSPRILMLEFNELCPTLLNRWMESGDLPNFKALYEKSQVFVTDADARPPALEPWIQWYSIHTGLSYSQHQIFRLTDGPRGEHPDLWSVVRQAGLTTGNFSSMNARRVTTPGSFFLADPWCTTEAAYPEPLQIFHNFVAKQVQEYSNPGGATKIAAAASFLVFMAMHGLRLRTVADIAVQLGHQLFDGQSTAWKRTVVLDWLQRDAFLNYYRKYRPAFATFFLNSTAHLQHSYWRHMDPPAFTVRPDASEVRRYQDAIKFGYQNMDQLIGDFLKLEAEAVTLILATALSQQPFVKYEGEGGQRFYRPRDIVSLLKNIGVDAPSPEPVMTHQYMLRFADGERRAQAISLLADLVCEGRQVFEIDASDPASLYIGCQLRTELPETALLRSAAGRAPGRRFLEVFYQIDAIKSGCHHPDGALWIKTGTPRIHAEKVSILDIFPTVIEMLGVDHSPTEVHPFTGTSLTRYWDRPEASEATDYTYHSHITTERATERIG